MSDNTYLTEQQRIEKERLERERIDREKLDARHDDHVQHGIDDNPNNDPEKAAIGGGVAGAVVGAIAGSMLGPLGAAAGAVVGATAGGTLSGAGVAVVDKFDNDNTVSGLGKDPTLDIDEAEKIDPATGKPYHRFDTRHDFSTDEPIKPEPITPMYDKDGHRIN